MSLSHVTIEQADRLVAATLLARRHAADRARDRRLPLLYESPDAVLPLIDRLLDSPGGAGVIAWRDGRPVAFLAGLTRTPSPYSYSALFQRPRSAVIPYHGFALSSGEDAEILRELYGVLSAGWVRCGYFSHYIELPALDFTASEAFASLGFGRDITLAARPVAAPVAAADAVAVVIQQAGSEDLDTIMRLSNLLAEHHALAPCFLPHLHEPDAEARELVRGFLVDPANAHMLAYRDGEALGMQTFTPPTMMPALATPERAIYLFDGVVDPRVRGSGIGRALLAEAMAWAQTAGYAVCALHFLAANLSGARFWQRHGFTPLTHRLCRQVDERIAWAVP